MQAKETSLIDPRLSDELQKLYDKLYADNKLVVGDELNGYYETFRNKFGPDRLLSLDGEELLFTLKGGKEYDGLSYWLEFKNDDEFPAIFGSVAGGSSFKYGIFLRADTGKWVSGQPKAEREITQEAAIEIAKEHRRQIIEGCKLLDTLRSESDEDYARLQQEMNLVAPFVSDTAWGHKYFSLLYPDKLDDFHVYSYQYFHLLKLLQSPPNGLGLYPTPGHYKPGVRYLAAGRFVRIAKSLGMATNTLTTLLYRRNGSPYTYWRIGTTSGSTGKSYWEEMRDGYYCAVGWTGTRDLSEVLELSTNNERKKRLREIVAQAYLDDNAAKVTKAANQLFDFLFTMKNGDLVLVSEGAKVLGIGQITGNYLYNATRDFAHYRSVKWLTQEEWQQPDQNPGFEGKLTTVYEMKRPLNLIEAERRIFDKETVIVIDTPVSTLEDEPGERIKPNVDIFADSKLVSIPEVRLKQQIAKLRRSILVEEKLVRRIYYALLNGNVILAGPTGTGKTELARLIPEILW